MWPVTTLANALGAERGHLFAWGPVFLASGIGIYFTLSAEPGFWDYGLMLAGGVVTLVLARFLPEGLRPLAMALALFLFGVVLAGARSNWVAAPQLSFRYYGPIEGRIVNIDRSQSDRPRLTLDRVRLENTTAARTPARVRVSLHGDQSFLRPEPGMIVMLTGHLAAPQGPVEPGGFDFQRKAWFDRLGAVGYTRTPALALARAAPGQPGLWIHRIRIALSQGIQARIPGEAGAFAAAILTGDRSGIGAETLTALRRSNLAHLLAISGLHMGLLTGFVFAALRFGLALIPYVALRWPVKKVAAVVAMIAAAVYLALSGGNIATQRAFIMVAVMLIAVLLERKAMTLRAVALAAYIVLILRPEALTGPGFQMSFAATAALVAVFGWLRDYPNWQAAVPGWLRPFVALVISSAVAGAATAPIAAVHFNQIAQFGLLANLLTVPVMGTVVIPAAVVGALLFPLGLSQIALEVMRQAILWILGVAQWVAGLDGATSHVATPGPWVLPLIAFGGIMVIVWQGRARLLGVPVLALAFVIWTMSQRPALLISDTGAVFGLMTQAGRVISKERGQGFVTRSWLENDGDTAPQPVAFARPGIGGEKGALEFSLGGQAFVHLSGKSATARLIDNCRPDVWVILVARADDGRQDCRLWDQARLAQTGAIAIYDEDKGLRIETSRDWAGERLWNRRAPSRGRAPKS